MNLSPHHLHIKELNVLGLPGGSGSGDEEDSPRKSKKKSRSPIEKPFSSSEEERLVKSSDDETSENYGTFGVKSSTPKKRPGVSPRLSKHSTRTTREPTEMEGSAVHGLDVFSHEEKASHWRKKSPPAIVRTRKFPPGSPPGTSASKSPEVSKDKPSTGAIPKKTVGKLGHSDKSASKHKSCETSLPRPESLPVKESDVKDKSVTPDKSEKSKVSKLKSTYRSPRKAFQKCLSYLTSPPKKDPIGQESKRPRTRSQTRKAKVEEQKQVKSEPKTQTKPTSKETRAKEKPSKKVRERSSSSSAKPTDRMSLISSVDKSSESDSSPQCSPRKSRKRRDPLLPSLFGKPLEDVCSIVSKPDSDSCVDMEIGPSCNVENTTGDKLLLPLAKLSTESDTHKEDSDEDTEERSESSSDD